MGDQHDSAADLRRELLERRMRGQGRSGRNPVTRRAQDGPSQLSSGQQRLWFLDQLAPGGTGYVVPLVLRLTGRLNTTALRSALTSLVQRHEILRTRYISVHGEPWQVVGSPEPVALPELRATEESLPTVIDGEVSRSFDLEHGPVWRTLLIWLSAEEHVLVITAHHIVCDGWSMSVLCRDLSALYQAALIGSDGPPPPSLGFADFAAWEQRQIAGRSLDTQLDYWRGALSGLVPLEFPADRPRCVPADSSGDRFLFEIPSDVVQAMLGLGRQAGTTPFMTFLAAYMVLLARYSGQPDVAVATPVLGRTRPEIEDVVGPFVNTLILRCAIDGSLTFSGLLARVREVCLEAFSHQDVPFDRVVAALPVHRDLSRTPIASVAFVMEGEEAEPLERLGDLACQEVTLPPPSVKFDLTLGLRGTGDRMAGVIDFAAALYDRETVGRLADRYLQLLRATASHADVPLAALSTPDETGHSTEIAPPARPAKPSAHCLHELVEQRVAQSPGMPAVVFEGSVRSYGELNERANRLARYLRVLGIGPESVVGVCLERGPDLILSLLAVLKSGGAYLPVDPLNPAERTRHMLADADARALITSSSLAQSLAGSPAIQLVLLDRDTEKLQTYADTDPPPLASPENLAYVIYTSGSTGRPKGVAVTHANVVRLLTVTHGMFDFRETDVWTMFHSCAFDFSVWETWGALVHGARLVVVPAATAQDPEQFLALLAAEQVTILNQTPSAFAQLVREDRRQRCNSSLSLRTIVLGGEAVDRTAVASWAGGRGLDHPTLVNMYGITETTVHAASHMMAMADLESGPENTIGRPLDDLAIRLLDGTGNPVPAGVIGEIHVGGPGVSRGYLHLPALTAERFVPDPFGSPGSRLYRSGDLARRCATGSLDYRGRIDNQVKIRGYRIEPGEIAEALERHARVREAVVAVREDLPGHRRLVAWLVPGEDGLPAATDLAAHCTALLPTYMVPAAYVELERIPLTINGKVDHTALPAPDAAAVASAGPPPETPQEQRMARLWADLLGVEQVGVSDDFFALGGDSMRAVRLVAGMRDAGMGVTVQDIFRYRTIAALAALTSAPSARLDDLRAERFALLTEGDRAMLPSDAADAYPLAQVQAGMLHEMLADVSVRPYHNVTAYPVRDNGEFSPEALRRAAQDVLDRHEVLRTSFRLSGYSEPIQVVHESVRPELTVDDLRGLGSAVQAEEIQKGIEAERSSLFDIEHAPLWRLHVYRTTSTDWWLALSECHPILDGWSHNCVLSELLSRYRVRRSDRVNAPAAATRRFADFVAIERATLGSEEQRSFWRDVLATAEGMQVPDGWGDGGLAGRVISHSEPVADLHERLRHLAVTVGASLKDVFLAAHVKVMSTLTHHNRFHFGLVTNGRPEVAGGDEVLGMYLNTVPLGVSRPHSTWQQLIGETADTVVAMWPHRRYPLPAMLGPRGLNVPSIEVVFNFLDFYLLDDSGIDLVQARDESPNEFPLQITVVPGQLVLNSRADKISADRLKLLGAAYRAVLESMAADPHGDATGPVQVLAEAQAPPARAYGPAVILPPRTLHELVGQQISATPDATAVIFEEGELSYRMLSAAASHLAGELRRIGVPPGGRVAVCLPRSPELVVALLAVLRAGAAFVPLDPDDPDGWLADLIAESESTALISDNSRAELARRTRVPLALAGIDANAAADEQLCAPMNPGDLAYIMYTSGSAGRPKGVMIPHLGIVNRIFWAQGIMRFGPGDRFLQKTPCTFDPSIPEFFLPLLTGSAVIVAPRHIHRDPVRLARFMTEQAVSHVHFVPAMLDAFLDTVDTFPSCVRCVICSGEALRRETADRLSQRSDARLLNLYGPTEASVDAIWHPVGRTLPEGGVPIGVPIDNMRAHILDPDLHPAVAGVPGELYLGGIGLARGYVSQAALTAERFVPDPHAAEPGARLYRTGDLARLSGSGLIEYLGRIDWQVKVNGVRVEPSQIEAALMSHPAVGTAAVVARDDGRGGRSLVAYLVPGRHAEFDLSQVRQHARARLPTSLVPTNFIVTGELPLTSSGKVDRRALSATAAGGDRPVPQLPPRTVMEQAVARIWVQELGVPAVGAHDAFQDLGGHSLLAMRVAARMQAELGLDVTSNDLMSRRTIADLALSVVEGDVPAGTSEPSQERKA